VWFALEQQECTFGNMTSESVRLVYEVVRRRTENMYLTVHIFHPALLITYLQACTALQVVAAVSQDVTFGLSIGTLTFQRNLISSYVIEPKIGLKGFLRNVGTCLSDYTAAGLRRS
jgi:hypothetical protein